MSIGLARPLSLPDEHGSGVEVYPASADLGPVGEGGHGGGSAGGPIAAVPLCAPAPLRLCASRGGKMSALPDTVPARRSLHGIGPNPEPRPVCFHRERRRGTEDSHARRPGRISFRQFSIGQIDQGMGCGSAGGGLLARSQTPASARSPSIRLKLPDGGGRPALG